MRLPNHIYSSICLPESWVSRINIICSHRQLKPSSNFYVILCFHANKMNSHFRCDLNWVGLSVSNGKIRRLSSMWLSVKNMRHFGKMAMKNLLLRIHNIKSRELVEFVVLTNSTFFHKNLSLNTHTSVCVCIHTT